MSEIEEIDFVEHRYLAGQEIESGQHRGQSHNILPSQQPEEISTEPVGRFLSPNNNSTLIKYMQIGMFFIVLGLFLVRTLNFPSRNEANLTTSNRVGTSLPKIVWIYTYHNNEGETAMNRIQFDYFNHTATTNGYEVRIVNSWNAYDWLSEGMTKNITTTIQKTKIDETVCSLLKLALLIEHGGIMVGRMNFLLARDDFSWIDKMFQAGVNASQYRIDPALAEVYMPILQHLPSLNMSFSQEIIAAMPNSKFILQTFQTLQKVITTGQLPFNQAFNFMQHNSKVNIDYLPLSIASISTIVVYQLNQSIPQADPYQYYSLQSKLTSNYLNLEDLTMQQQLKVLKDDESSYLSGKDLVMGTYKRMVEIVDVMLGKKVKQKINNGSLLHRLVSVPGNEPVFTKKNERRKIELCVVFMDADGLDENETKKAQEVIRNQRSVKKRLIIFTKNQVQPSTEQNTTFIQTTRNQVRNIEIAATQYCPAKSYMVLMRAGESYSTSTILSIIALSVQDPAIVAASINLMIQGMMATTYLTYHHFLRSRDGTINPKLDIMNGILNHLRIISVDAFRYIPQLQWRDTYGNYMEDRFIILQSLLELIEQQQKASQPEHRHKYLYIKKKYADVFHFPSLAVYLPPEAYINSDRLEKISMEQLERTKYRFNVESIHESMMNCQQWGVPFSKMLTFNPGTQFVPIDKKTGPQLIPKVIHQAWLGGQMPIAQKYFFKKTQGLYPSYKMILWTQQNITRQNFPHSYDIMQTLLAYQRSGKSAYNKYATITDLLKHEVMYSNGGFWRDAGMNLFRPVFDQFTKYKLVIGGEATVAYRWAQGMRFFANQPKSEHMNRVSNYRNVNRMRYYHDQAASIAGSIDFRQVLTGSEEFSPDILLLHFEYFYAGQVSHPYGDQCFKSTKPPGQIYEFEYKGWAKIPECEKNYPIAFGQDHNMLGVSWSNPQ